MLRSRPIRLIGVEDRFVEAGHVVVDDTGAVPEVVMFEGEPFIAVHASPPPPPSRLEYRKVRPFRFVRKALP